MTYIYKFFICAFLLNVGIAFAAKDTGGFSLGSSRVIYDGAKNEATIAVINTAKNSPFLAQSWISSYTENDKAKPPFVLTPPLYRQDTGKNTLRIVRTGGNLPADRESVFWLNVKAIPATAKPDQTSSSLIFAYVMRIKLFYRPAGISGNSVSAYKELSFSRQGDKLIAKNPTPYHITLNKVSIGGKEIKDVAAMVPPLSEQSYLLPGNVSGNQVSYKAVNDQGGVTPEENKNL